MSGQVSEVVIIVAAGTVVIFLLLTFLLTMFLILQRKQLVSQQEKAALHTQYAKEIIQAQVEIQNSTLQQIAEELHDNIGQLLFVAKININLLEETEQNDENNQRIIQINEAIELSINEVRALTKSFDGDFVRDFGLQNSLDNELARIQKTGTYQIAVTVRGERYSLGFEKEIVLFRICQEILNNIMKHSKAKNIAVVLEYEVETWLLCISDDGRGFDHQFMTQGDLQHSGSGLRNMRRRTEMLGGNFTLESGLGNGTKIQIVLPRPAITNGSLS
ncbi:sensor histidine kinase [Dyadobacter sp. BHUBP1]|uniref:sensor histidine kinase n=1 Tax=Dyadobacter sp. BHUBP1 TaxID=3424178 RepID=UPI003D358BB2